MGAHADRASPVEHRAELVHEEYATAIAKLDANFSPHIVDPSARPLTRRLNEHPRVVGLVFGQFRGVSKAVHTLLKETANAAAFKHWRQAGAKQVASGSCLRIRRHIPPLLGRHRPHGPGSPQAGKGAMGRPGRAGP